MKFKVVVDIDEGDGFKTFGVVKKIFEDRDEALRYAKSISALNYISNIEVIEEEEEDDF